SEHPLAAALIAAAGDPARFSVSESHNAPGQGVEALLDGRRMRVGRPDYVAALAAEPLPDLDDEASTAIALGDDQGLLAIIYLRDSLREDAAEMVAALRALGVGVEIVSGDRAAPVAATARALGEIPWRADQSPEQKLAYVRELQQQGQRIAMIGDGINDAPVLAGADVSLAVGSGTHVAQASADMLLMSARLMPLAEAVRVARRTTTVIKQNLIWALVYNIVAIPVAAAGVVAPWMAALGMSISSLIVVMNALRLR
ncbi:MAG TPA: HAD family hydrolase, partial [Chromatiaceae bacterium]|nr:HAD family hydrolase [Chromatiaceae bacterium]